MLCRLVKKGQSIMLSTLFSFFESTIGSLPVLFIITIISFLVHACLLTWLLITRRYNVVPLKPWVCLLSVLVSSMFVLLAWVFELVHLLFIPMLSYNIVYFWICIAWAFIFVLYQSSALFIETLLGRYYRLSIDQKIFIAISGLFFSFFIFCAFLGHDNGYEFIKLFNISNLVPKIGMIYFIVLMGTTLLRMNKKLKLGSLPAILKKRFNFLISVLIIPSLICNYFQIFSLGVGGVLEVGSVALVTVNVILNVCVLFFIAYKMVCLRFLTIREYAPLTGKLKFINELKELVRKFFFATHTYEFELIAQEVFEKAFNIPRRFVQLHIRMHYKYEEPQEEHKHIVSAVESLLDEKKSLGASIMAKEKILIYDEIESYHFYDQSIENKLLLEFLDNINADVFLPVYDDQEVIAYLIVERNARPNKFFGEVERGEMLALGHSLANFIDRMQFNSVLEITYRRKRQDEECFLKQNEADQYRKGLRLLVYGAERAKVGIIFYENGRFIFGGKEAEELITIDLNLKYAHPLTKALKVLAKEVEHCKKEKSITVRAINRRELVVSATINQEGGGIIFIVHYLDLSSIISRNRDLVPDPAKSDYLFYLETAEAGKLIDQYIPGIGSILLDFKAALMKVALGNRAILLDMPKDGVRDVVDLLHGISSYEKIHILSLTHPKKNNEDTIALFGINSVHQGSPQQSSPQEEPLVKRLDKIGTLFIENVHFLSRGAQEQLAEFISYGSFHTFGIGKPVMSDVRLIFSTDQDLGACVEEGTFSKTLYRELKKRKLSMPSLILLSEEEFKDLVSGIEGQLLSEPEYKNFLCLSDKDKEECARKRPKSLKTLREKIIHLLEEQSKSNCEETDAMSEQKLAEVTDLSKQALKRSNNHEDVVEKVQK